MKTPGKKKESNGSSAEYKKSIEENKEIANQLSEAAKLHLTIATQMEANNPEEAFEIAVKAYGFLSIIKEAQQKILSILL